MSMYMKMFRAIFGAAEDVVDEDDADKRFTYRSQDNILLEPYKAVYFPIPKIASSSLKVVFSDTLGMIPPYPEQPSRDAHNRNFPYALRDELDTKYADYFKFAVVRNPYSRVLSCYKNKIRKEMDRERPGFSNGVHKALLKYGRSAGFWKYKKFHREMSLDDFIEAIKGIPDHHADRHFRSQAAYLCAPDGHLYPNYLAKFEHLAKDLGYIFDKLGLPPTTLPHLVESGTGNSYHEHFSERGKQLVYERYARDFELFDYEF